MDNLIGAGVSLAVAALGWVGIYHLVRWVGSHPDLAVSLVGLGFLVLGSWLVLRACVEVDR